MSSGVEVQRASAACGVPPAAALVRWAEAALAGRSEGARMTVRVVDEAEGATLNERYRGRSGPTNVLAFHVRCAGAAFASHSRRRRRLCAGRGPRGARTLEAARRPLGASRCSRYPAPARLRPRGASIGAGDGVHRARDPRRAGLFRSLRGSESGRERTSGRPTGRAVVGRPHHPGGAWRWGRAAQSVRARARPARCRTARRARPRRTGDDRRCALGRRHAGSRHHGPARADGGDPG